jgi:glycosyltransferase involved in cell wall biosynthesis
VDTERFKPAPDREELRRRLELAGIVILSAGNLIELKGHHLVIEAITNLPDVILLVAGEGPRRKQLEDRAAELGVGDRVRFLGALPQSELIPYYGAADALVLASSSEGSPNVVLESLACGTRVISTVESAVPDGPSAADVTVVERSAPALQDAIRQLPVSGCGPAAVRLRALSLSWDATCAALGDVLQHLRHDPVATAA